MQKPPPGQKKEVCTKKPNRWQSLSFIISLQGVPFFCSNHTFFSSVPSRAPSNVTFTNVSPTEITVHWNPLPEQYVNGRLLGYKVVYYLYSPYEINSVNVTNPNTTWVTLTALRPRRRYYIWVTAFTSKGVGPYSYNRVTTG